MVLLSLAVKEFRHVIEPLWNGARMEHWLWLHPNVWIIYFIGLLSNTVSE